MDQREHLGSGVREIVDNMLLYEKIGIGGLVRITAEDAQSGLPQDVRLQLVALHEIDGCDRQRAIFEILDDDFNFYSPRNTLHGGVAKGTLCLGGLSMQWLPVPRYVMVGFGGIGKGRDFSLEYVDGQQVDMTIHNITALEITPPPADFMPPDVSSFCQFVSKLVVEERAASQKDDGRKRGDLMAGIREALGTLPDWLESELTGCHVDGVMAIGSLLIYAKEQAKIERAMELVTAGFREQWSYQHPSIRGAVEFGSNRQYLDGLYAKLGITLEPSHDLTQSPSDAELQGMRAMLEDPDLSQFEEVETVSIKEMPAGQIILANTKSGNRYLIRVVDPGCNIVSILMLEHRPGFPENGVIPPAGCRDLERGQQLVTANMNSSRLVRIFVRRVE